MSLESVPGQPALLRELNDRAALTLLLDNGPLTRNEIATRTGLSKPTAAEIIRRLETAALIREAGAKPARRGPSAVLYEAVTDKHLAVAIDLQLHDVRSGVVDARGTQYQVAEHRLSDSDMQGDPIALLMGAIQRATDAAGVDGDDVIAVCIGLQASVDHATDSLTFTDELPQWPRGDVAQTLSDELGVRVLLENDANLAAIAERNAGVGRTRGSFALLWIAEGLGMALDIDGRVHSGASGAAGEIGYLGAPVAAASLDPAATVVADLVLDSAVTQLARTAGLTRADGTDAEWRDVLALLPSLDDRHPLFAALAERIGYNVLPALAVADPECVILHGPTGIAGGTALAAATTAWVRTRTRWSTPVLSPGVVDTPVLDGARHVLIDSVRSALAQRLSHADANGLGVNAGAVRAGPTTPESSSS